MICLFDNLSKVPYYIKNLEILKSITRQKMFYSMYMCWGDIVVFNAFIGEIFGTQVTVVAFCWTAETKLDKLQILLVDAWFISCCLTVCS